MQPAATTDKQVEERPRTAPVPTGNLRKESRQQVDSQAVLHLVSMGAELPGRILDLSESGCRIQTLRPLLVGVFRRVEVEFKIEGLPFRLGGVTQAIYDRHNVGIRFLDVSERKREQLRQLMREMAENDPAIKIAPCADAASEGHAGESANASHRA
ncbi:MAG TPA: PilZ domain-containing protein [Terracidiphilus sp.]|jgi:hypothetical protein|nr:PilZ domain-containing protein [Terracidiphilus sp.]